MEAKGKKTFSAVLTALWLALAPLAAAQQGSASGSSQQNQQSNPQKPLSTGPDLSALSAQPAQPSADEEAAYKNFLQIKPQDVDQQIQAAEQFVQKYPTSRYLSTVYSALAEAHFNKGEIDKMMVTGDKALALDSNNVSVLMLLGWVIPHRYDPNDLEKDQKLDKAEYYCKRGLELLSTLTKPVGMSDDTFASLKNQGAGEGHGGLGLVYFHRGQYAQSVSELQEAIKLSNQPDPVNYYVMGVGQQKLKQYVEAASSFQKCSESQSSLQSRCKDNLEQVKKLVASQPSPVKP